MAYPPAVALRPCTLGGSTALESGTQLVLSAEITASRSLKWGATGWQFPSLTRTVTGTEGAELSFSLPVTDLAGWRLNDDSGSIIDVSTPGSYTHTYTVKLKTLSGGRQISERTIGPFVLPAEDLSPIDLDLMLPAPTIAGGVVLVPGTWDARVAAAEAAAVAAEAAVVDAASWVLGVGPVTMPPGVPALPCNFTRGADGIVTHDMDFTPYRTAPTEIWVANTGNDTTGAGTQAQPYRTMYKAWDMALAAPGDAVIRTGEAFMDRNGGIVNSARTITDKRVSVIGTGAQPTILSSANAALTWVDDAGAWKATRSGCRAVYSTALDDNGAPIPTPAATSLANCQATPNSWWTDGASVWINTGGTAPTTATHHVCITVVLFDVTLLGSAELYVENITFLGGNENAVKISGSATSQGKFIANNVRFVGGDRRPIATGTFGNALAVTDISRTFLFGCVAAYAIRDGFNYHYPLVALQDRRDRLVVEYGCLSYSHGEFNTEGNNNATTAHEGIAIVRVNCEGHSTTGPVLADVQGCLSVLIDCWMHDSLMATKELYLFADAGGEAWLYNCRAGGVGAYDLSTSSLDGGVNLVGRWRGHRINAPLVRWLD